MPDPTTLKKRLAQAEGYITRLESILRDRDDELIDTHEDLYFAEQDARNLRDALQRLYDAILDAPPGGERRHLALLHLRDELLETGRLLESTAALQQVMAWHGTRPKEGVAHGREHPG